MVGLAGKLVGWIVDGWTVHVMTGLIIKHPLLTRMVYIHVCVCVSMCVCISHVQNVCIRESIELCKLKLRDDDQKKNFSPDLVSCRQNKVCKCGLKDINELRKDVL